MSGGRHAFRRNDAARLIRAAQDAGLKVIGLEHDLAADKIRVLVGDGGTAPPSDTSWDDLKPDAQEQDRPL